MGVIKPLINVGIDHCDWRYTEIKKENGDGNRTKTKKREGE
jgi:hypothetical protein